MKKKRVLTGLLATVGILLAVYVLSAGHSSMQLTEMDVMATAGNALTPVIPEEYVFTQYETDIRKVRVNDEVRQALKVLMIYGHPQTREREQYEVYLDPESGELLGFGARRVLAPTAE